MPTLQKWINLTCNPRRVAEIWNESQSSDKPLDIEIVATRVKEFCKLLASLKPTNSDYIILALKFYENGIETIDAELIKGDDLHRAGMFLRDEFILKEKPLPSISPNSSNQELEAFLEHTTGWVPQAFAYEYTPWEEVLGSSVLFPNVTHVGNEEFLAAALYNMSFNGMTKEAQEQERKKLSNALAEIKSGACTYTAHKVLSDLEQTEAETAKEKRQSLLDRAMTRYAWLMEISYLYDDKIFLRSSSSSENESGSEGSIKRVNLENLPKKLTTEEQSTWDIESQSLHTPTNDPSNAAEEVQKDSDHQPYCQLDCQSASYPTTELELSDDQVARIDAIHNAAYEFCKIMAEDENLFWSMDTIQQISEFAAELLTNQGSTVRFPAVVIEPDGKQYIEEIYTVGD